MKKYLRKVTILVSSLSILSLIAIDKRTVTLPAKKELENRLKRIGCNYITNTYLIDDLRSNRITATAVCEMVERACLLLAEGQPPIVKHRIKRHKPLIIATILQDDPVALAYIKSLNRYDFKD
ncbi:hypothetical protein KBC04_04970 [Candidatus Babeliales bacterium]|nr:hypothetical protein [Candidatus Babeliales bacterium]MBP9844315.1 hypothetical protein [Candidatus Babeliales bacterium]